MTQHPKVLIAILARDKEATLPLYLECISNLDYPKDRISLYIRTNNNSDNTENILRDFVEQNMASYSSVFFNSEDESPEINNHKHHDWCYPRFKVLGKIRNESMRYTLEAGCDFYFVADCDNFVLPHTLKNLVSYNLPIVSPLLANDQSTLYANFHYECDANGYLQNHPMYNELFARNVVGLVQVKVVHCTYLVRADVIDKLTYDDGSGRYEYVIFSDSARKSGVPQYLDNTCRYGVITFKTKVEEMDGFKDSYLK